MSSRPTPRELTIALGELPSPPHVYRRLTAELEQPDWSIAGVARVVNTDPAVVARVLRLVNSPYYGLRREVGSTWEAVVLLGAEEVRSLVLATTVLEQFQGIPRDLLSVEAFARRAVHCGVTCGRLAGRSAIALESGHAFISGMLQDIGSMVVCLLLPEAARSVLMGNSAFTGVPGRTIECAVMGEDEPRVGPQLLEHWRLPDSHVAALRWQVRPEQAERHPREAALLHLGVLISAELRAEARGDPVDLLCADDPAWRIAAIDPEAIEGIGGEVSAGYAQAMAVLA